MKCIWSEFDKIGFRQQAGTKFSESRTQSSEGKVTTDYHSIKGVTVKTNQAQSKIGSAILGFSLLLGIGIAFSSTALAQYPNDQNPQDRDRDGDQNRGRDWDRYGDYGGSSQLRQTALNAGYNEGASQGRNARYQNDRSYDYRELSSYRNATIGYRSRLGDREIYRRYFQEAFESGYEANVRRNRNRNQQSRDWDGYGNFGGSAQLRQTALNAGYNEGNKQGQDDRNKSNGNRNSYQNQSAYRKATKDYSSRLGDRELYRRYFRDAYKTGYRDGLNGS